MFVPFVVVGIVMASVGIYVLITKNVFGKHEPWILIVEALKLNKKAVTTISIVFGVFFILMGMNFLINGLLSPDPLRAFWFIP